ncbi:electron transfer flavoprotein subunit alpha/FixB family protein [Paraburkholderia sp. B3]|uniref:electron transfer flavoprotein subunit alpha/FixB family protein n=1 Tax=Paraburkholderia sp. B3 TaxID=3134791 RepID=UPI003982CC37
MTTTLKRIDPRRPFTITAAGLRRITLGAADETHALHDEAAQFAAAMPTAHGASTKPRRTMQAAQRTLLVAAHSDRGALDEHARQTLAAAALIAGAATQVVLVVFGAFHDDGGALGADKIIELASFGSRAFAPEREVQALAACVARFAPDHVLLPDNAYGDGDLGRRYAALAGASAATNVVQIDAAQVGAYVHARRSLAMRALPGVVLLAPGAVDPRLPFVGAGERIAADIGEPLDAADAADSRYADRGIEAVDAARVALEEADFIVSAGNGVSDVAAFGQLAEAFGAAVGASRVAVDNGLFRRDQQIGATGKTVEASVYVAFGISGAVQHLQGIKDCRHVIAVNLDASAPIVKRANLTIVGDTQSTIASLIDEIGRAREAASHPRDAARLNQETEGVPA